MKNEELCTITVDVQLQPNGKYDVYLSTEGSSGAHYTNLTDEQIGQHVTELVQCYAEA